jgi:CRISPR system Cascade subunit CasC
LIRAANWRWITIPPHRYENPFNQKETLMTTFLQLHMLTSYPPACLNRDDLNRPKTTVMGGVPRLRISSQSLKRAWRTSSHFEETLKGHVGTRTKAKGVKIYQRLVEREIKEKDAKAWSQKIAMQFGKLKAPNKEAPLNDLEIEQLAHFSPDEESAIDQLVDKLISSKTEPSEEQLNLLRRDHTAADIALFGRMLADSPAFNTEAACQVAHAITVHRAAVEDDYFTAVDDLNTHEEHAGSAHIGEQGFGAGLFYLYTCIDCDLLNKNLNGASGLAPITIKALVEAAAMVAPTGKQNSFASRAWAYYVLAEKGDRQPRSLSLAFMKPVGDGGEGMLANAVSALKTMRNNMDKVYYGAKSLPEKSINSLTGEGDFQELCNWAADIGGI